MKKTYKICKLLDCMYYLAAQIGIFAAQIGIFAARIGIFAAAFNGSLIWVCVFGFCLIDGGITLLFGKNLLPKEVVNGQME